MSLAAVIRNSGKLLRSVSYQVYAANTISSEQSISTSPSNVSTVENNDMPVEIENPFVKEKPQCILCKMDITPTYKNVRLLSQFVSPYTGRIYGRHITRLCKHKHELVEKEITKAKNAGFMPYMNKEPRFLKDPKLFNPEKPMRNHDYC
ncbi:small ribosomal subunit protein bS18m [Halyomorpha halys]|uniref:small ribosomal subunit protein bS18m n=1 Tax=Halyomorpha halys TaxID=286706 RepID=UPI0006D52466|nr:28S ribosomal protein S18c, mitochondrial [Halyomorpha halys]